MRAGGVIALWLLAMALLCAFVVIVAFPIGVYALLHVKREGLMKIKRLFGGLFVAVGLAVFVLPYVLFECVYWWQCWPFGG